MNLIPVYTGESFDLHNWAYRMYENTVVITYGLPRHTGEMGDRRPFIRFIVDPRYDQTKERQYCIRVDDIWHATPELMEMYGQHQRRFKTEISDVTKLPDSLSSIVHNYNDSNSLIDYECIAQCIKNSRQPSPDLSSHQTNQRNHRFHISQGSLLILVVMISSAAFIIALVTRYLLGQSIQK